MTPRRRVLVTLTLATLACRDGGERDPRVSEEAVAAAAWTEEVLPVALTPEEVDAVLRLGTLGAPPVDPTNRVAEDARAARLGQALFFDPRLSGNGAVSCATCHVPESGFSNAAPVGVGVGLTERNVPSLWNLAWNRWFFWDGRADTAWLQALKPLEAPNEHGTTRVAVAATLAGDRALAAAYEELFGALPDVSDASRFPRSARPDPLEPWTAHHRAWTSMAAPDREVVTEVFVNVGKVIAAYERLLVSDRSPFDVFVEGLRSRDAAAVSALSPDAVRGLKLFTGEGKCLACHHGPNLTDGEFHDVLVPGAADETGGRYLGARRVKADPLNSLSRHADNPSGDAAWKVRFLALPDHGRREFKTPTLRNVATTAPYFHDGSQPTLEDVVRHYSTFENAPPPEPQGETILQPLGLSDDEVADLVAFLEALTDEDVPPALLKAPPGHAGADRPTTLARLER